MKICIALIVLLSSSFSLPAFALSSHAYIVDAKYQVRLISLTGTNHVKSPENFALNISAGDDGTVWVVSTDQGKRDRGGNLLKVLRKGETEWQTINIDSGAEALSVSADASGGAWVIDGQTRNIIQIDRDGKVISEPTDLGPMFAVSASFSSGYSSTSQIWAISSETNHNIGNPVYYMFPKDGKWKSRGVGAHALSGYWTVSDDGRVITVASDSSTHQFAPAGTASSISLGKSGIWIISTEANIEQGGAYLKIWNQQGPGAKNWEKIPNVGARSVSAL